MNWTAEATRLFKTAKPEHFTNYRHCCECEEHDETLRNTNVENISMEQLGNPAWDPLCFCTLEAKKYYLPAMIRLCIETLKEGDAYVGQLLFHLSYDGEKNDLVMGCTSDQRQFIASFMEYLIEHYAKELDENYCSDDAIAAYEIWR